MSDSAVSAEQGSDPLKAVADALESASAAVKQGAADAGATAAAAVPVARKMMADAVYKACYGISYGVVFPTMLIARSIPPDNPIVHGLVDGSRAAIDMVNEIKGKAALEAPAAEAAIAGTGVE